jgi:putative FmdB family regulatory protein
MPLYDYRCTACGRLVEVMHGIHDPGPAACTACGGSMQKVLSPPAIHFKGSGWAKKDAATSARKTSSKPTADAGDSSKGAADREKTTGTSSTTSSEGKSSEGKSSSSGPKTATTAKSD